MVEGRMGVLWTCAAALLALASAGPLQRFSREADDDQGIDLSAYANFTANEVCFSDNEVFQKGDLMPNPGPCEECRCEPPSIVCSMIKCPVNNNGCRTIQRPNHCCPDYNCECDYNGQLYNDGERVDMPEDPCQVCYCKGGEVMCNSITCYHRDDCEPKHVPGQCCPKYENCPVKGTDVTKTDDKNSGSRSPNKTLNNSPKRDMTPWLLTKSVPKTSILPVSKQPATSEQTTENGNIIIVSDWLTERRTTTEDATHQGESKYEGLNLNHTEGPMIVTDPLYLTTIQQQNVNSFNSEGSVLKKSETMTPLDEVIFTRIDMIKENQGGNMKSSSAPSNTETTITTLVPPNSFSSKANEMISTTQSTTNEELSTIYDFNESGDEDEISLQSSFGDGELQNNMENKLSGGFEIHELTSPTEILATDSPEISSNEKVLEKTPKHSNSSQTTANVENVTMIYVSQNTNIVSGNDMVTKNILNSEEPLIKNTLELSPKVGQSSETNRENSNKSQDNKVSEEINLENLFGLERSNDKEIDYITTNQPTTISTISSTVKVDNPISENVNSVPHSTTKIKEMQESFKPQNSREDFNDNSLENEDKSLAVAVLNDEMSDSTVTSINEIENTTPYFTEDHMSRFNLASNKFTQEQTEEEIVDEELTTESMNPTITTTAVPEPYNEINLLNKRFLTNDTSIIAHNISNGGNYIQRLDEKNENMAEPNNMSTVKDTKLSDGNPLNNENISSPVTEINFEETQPNTNLGTVSHISQDSANQNMLHMIEDSQKTNKGQEGLVDPHEKDDSSEDPKDQPPILELNSHVPFLQLGGSGSSDASEILQDDYQTTIPSQTKILSVLRTNESTKEGIHLDPTTTANSGTGNENVKKEQSDSLFTTISPLTYSEEENISNSVTHNKYIGELKTFEPELGTIPTTSHIPLTPGDLKTLAEYLIHEKIKTVKTQNESQYSVNPWLKGNLTSEERIASIISAANITIGIMNQTDIKARTDLPETSTKTNEIIRVEKPEKDSLFKGNSILNNGIGIANKTDYLHNKYNKNQGFHKVNSKIQNALYVETTTENDISTDSTTSKEASMSTLYRERERDSDEDTDQTTELPAPLNAIADTDLNYIGQQDVEIKKNVSDDKIIDEFLSTTTLNEIESSTLTSEIENKITKINNTSQNTPQDDPGIAKESRLNTSLDEPTTKTDGGMNIRHSEGDLLRNQETSESQSKGKLPSALENNDLTIPKAISQKPVVIT